MSEFEDDQVDGRIEDEAEDDDPPEPEWQQIPPELPEHVPDDWLDQKPFDPAGR